MDIKNCSKCNKLYNFVAGQNICPACRTSLEDKFKDVRLYVRKNSRASISEISEATDVDIRQIRQWVREERLSFSEESSIGIDCELCGKTIRTGKYCPECKTNLGNNLNSAIRKPEVKEEVVEKESSTKMRFLNKDNM